MPHPVYLVDFSVYNPPEELKMNYEDYKQSYRLWKEHKDDNMQFMCRVFERSGIGANASYLPPWISPMHVRQSRNDMDSAMREAQMVMVGAVTDLLEKTGTHPSEVDILVTNCSIYCPTPSLASMLVNHFKFKPTVQSYHLGGMGCGNGVVALSLIKDLLQARPNAKALFVPAEITTYCYYPGAHKDYMVANAIFRMGGAAALLSNQARYYSSAKYELLHNARAHTGQDDGSYGCMGWGPDPDGVNGVFLRKDVPAQAAKALEVCLREVAPKILTWRQCGEAVAAAVRRRLLGQSGSGPGYVPDFTQCIDHFALHAGGYGVLKGLMSVMRLPAERMLPSFATLRDFGNTSCSTTWYVMAYMETCQQVKQGQTIMQIGMGGGMKAGVNIWRANRDITTTHPAWRHVAGRPVTEADLPRPISDDVIAAAALKQQAAAAEAAAAAAADKQQAADQQHKAAAQGYQQQQQLAAGGGFAAAPAVAAH